jgi:hypothetical protein
MRGRVGPLAALWAGALAATGCSGDPECASRAVTTEAACKISQDCVDAGYQGLTCLDGRCQKPCRTDAECVPPPLGDDESPMCRAEVVPAAVCEAQLCVLGCPDAPCQAGESCVAGRCVYFEAGFEIPPGGDVADLGQLGWNGLPTALTNRRTKIVFSGLRGCTLGDETCAGTAGEGVRFLALERQPTQAKGTAATDLTCRPCACCLACLFEPEGDPPPQLSSCPGDRPSPLSCPVSTPTRCDAVCQQCAACPDADPGRIGERLTTCEASAAAKTCPACQTCESDKATCRAAMCPSCATEPSGEACVDCVDANCRGSQGCLDCQVCTDARQKLITDPGSAETQQLVARCDAQGVDGCFETAVSFGRSQLEDAEQATVSPEIDLSGATGQVVLQFEHVPFNVGEVYRPGIQGADPSTWPLAEQAVRVELCGGACETPGSWSMGVLTAGGQASLPATNRRRNGLLLGSQTALDWQAGRVEVAIPEALRTARFRFRFVPDIEDAARLGVDHIVVRRVQ